MNRRVLCRHVFDHPGQMRDIVRVDQRIDEVAGKPLVAIATGGRANRAGMNG